MYQRENPVTEWGRGRQPPPPEGAAKVSPGDGKYAKPFPIR